jgi:hypothetical protein
MRPRCPKCGSAPSYEEGGYHVCMMGGHRWPVNGAKPIIVHKRMEEESMEGTKPTSGKKGTCVNCEREKFIADKEGLCSTCHNAVAGISKDSVAYTAALADVKKRLINNPSRRGKVAKAKAMAAAPVKRSKPQESVLDRTIKQVARAGVPAIIAQARIELDGLMSEADKLTKAINILESL